MDKQLHPTVTCDQKYLNFESITNEYFKYLNNDKPAFVWWRVCNKPLFQSMMIQFTHIYESLASRGPFY